MMDRFLGTNLLYTRIMIRMQRRRALASPVSEFLGTAVMIIIMVYGASLVLAEAGDLNPEEFIGYLMLFTLLSHPPNHFRVQCTTFRKDWHRSTGCRMFLMPSVI
jgi:ATP-binding cassette, subfamily B, bacterial MsbA